MISRPMARIHFWVEFFNVFFKYLMYIYVNVTSLEALNAFHKL